MIDGSERKFTCAHRQATAQPSNAFSFFFLLSFYPPESLFAHLRPGFFVAVGTRVCFRDRGKNLKLRLAISSEGIKRYIYKKRG